MADTPTIQTRKLTREQIADVVGKNPRAIKLIEALTADVSQTLPDAIAGTTEDAGSLLAADAYRRRAVPALPFAAESDASAVIASQVFGA